MKSALHKREKVFEHLILMGSITVGDALALYGVTRLAADIYALRKRGYDIQTKLITKPFSTGSYTCYVFSPPKIGETREAQ